MSKTLHEYYQSELFFIRQTAQEFAKQFPATANRLLLETNRSLDPHVERLLEGFALLAGRVQHKLDDEFPELTDALLSVLYPHYLAPIPSMAIVQFDLDPERAQLPDGFAIDKHSLMHTPRVGGVECKFRTGYPTTLWPVAVTDAKLLQAPFPQAWQAPAKTKAALRLQIETTGELPFAALSLDRLRLFLSNDNAVVASLYELIFNHVIQVVFRTLDRDSKAPPFVLKPQEALFPVGFDGAEGLLPYTPQSFPGYRLLTEFFAFPSKFWFVDVGGFRRARQAGYQRKLEIVLFLDRKMERLESVIDATAFKLGCTPAVNLFEQTAEPIALNQTKTEYRVVPDVAAPQGTEVYSIEAATSVDPVKGTTEYQPFYSFRHGGDRRTRRTFWYAVRRPVVGEGDRGHDVYLNLVDLDFEPRVPAEKSLVVRTLCTNRDLPLRLAQASEGFMFELEMAAPVNARHLPARSDVAAASAGAPRRVLAAVVASIAQSPVADRSRRRPHGAARNPQPVRFLRSGGGPAAGAGDAAIDRGRRGGSQPARRRAHRRPNGERFLSRHGDHDRVRRGEIRRQRPVSLRERAGTLSRTVRVREFLQPTGGDDAQRPGRREEMAAARRRTAALVVHSRSADASAKCASHFARRVGLRSMKDGHDHRRATIRRRIWVSSSSRRCGMLERASPQRRPVGLASPPRDEIVRFRAHLSLSFPPSTIYEVERPKAPDLPPLMTVTFFGLTGPTGILPRHYTEMLIRLDRETRGPERYALRTWLDQFNHRLISLFYRAWEKYRFFIPYERGEALRAESDTFTQMLFSFVGLGTPALRQRLRVTARVEEAGQPRERVLAEIDDLALLYYGGLLAQRPHTAVGLAALLRDYFELPLQVQQFHGQWLRLDADSQTRLGAANCEMGLNMVAGERVWDVQSKLRLRLGPLRREQFDAFLPDRAAITERKAFFLLVQLARLYLGPDFDFDVQLVLRKEDVPSCQLAPDGLGPRLGWNTWLSSQPRKLDAADPVFEGIEVARV